MAVDFNLFDEAMTSSMTFKVNVKNDDPYFTTVIPTDLSVTVGKTLSYTIPVGTAIDPEANPIIIIKDATPTFPSYLTFNTGTYEYFFAPALIEPRATVVLKFTLSDEANIITYSINVKVINDDPSLTSLLTPATVKVG